MVTYSKIEVLNHCVYRMCSLFATLKRKVKKARNLGASVPLTLREQGICNLEQLLRSAYVLPMDQMISSGRDALFDLTVMVSKHNSNNSEWEIRGSLRPMWGCT